MHVKLLQNKYIYQYKIKYSQFNNLTKLLLKVFI
jgi:hypothetical protein